ncbi:MAG: hypothetical protein IIB75_04535 [Proteobacteria bacterium]|nr:hypothetical protein [Pseudomonadota bacterium]
MRSKGLFNWIEVFETGLSAAERVWRIMIFVFVGGSSALTAIIAKSDPIFENLGPIYWIAVGLITAVVISVILFLIKSSHLKDSERHLNNALAKPRTAINPLAHSFSDLIIPVEDLRLPTLQLHENKHFKNSKFVGPAALAIIGGNYINSGFIDCGDVIALPDKVRLTGIVVLKNCTVEDCEFIRTTILADQRTAKALASVPGVQIRGLSA